MFNMFAAIALGVVFLSPAQAALNFDLTDLESTEQVIYHDEPDYEPISSKSCSAALMAMPSFQLHLRLHWYDRGEGRCKWLNDPSHWGRSGNR